MNAFLEHLQMLYWPTLQVVWPALLVALSLAISGAVTGTFVLLRDEALLALSLPQVVTLGAACALRLDWPTLPMAAAAVAIVVAMVARRRDERAAVGLLPALYVGAAGLAILVVFSAAAELVAVQNLFVGIDVAVGSEQAVASAIPLILLGLIVVLLWRRWLLMAQAPLTAELAGLSPRRWNFAFLCLLSAIVLLGTNALGNIITIALLFLPGAAILPLSRRIPTALLAAAITGILMLLAGTILSIEIGWPLSQSVAAAGFAAVCLIRLALPIFRLAARWGYPRFARASSSHS